MKLSQQSMLSAFCKLIHVVQMTHERILLCVYRSSISLRSYSGSRKQDLYVTHIRIFLVGVQEHRPLRSGLRKSKVISHALVTNLGQVPQNETNRSRLKRRMIDPADLPAMLNQGNKTMSKRSESSMRSFIESTYGSLELTAVHRRGSCRRCPSAPSVLTGESLHSDNNASEAVKTFKAANVRRLSPNKDTVPGGSKAGVPGGALQKPKNRRVPFKSLSFGGSANDGREICEETTVEAGERKQRRGPGRPPKSAL